MTPEKNKEKSNAPAIRRKRPSSILEPYTSDMWSRFDNAFSRFRRDFEDLLQWPIERETTLSEMTEKAVSIDLEEKADRYVLVAETPGYKKDEIEINVTPDVVEISGCKETSKNEENKNYIRRERSSESFYRKMPLPAEIMVEQAQANLKDGILEVVLPKKEVSTSKKVEIK